MQDFEKLGLFYLGREYDLDTGKLLEKPILYDSRDLLTHALCVGMTGSGKTGLCLGLVEEAAIDGVPVIAIDPKGDLGNLLLTFPGLATEDFRPWIDENEARRAGKTADAFAEQQAQTWRRGSKRGGRTGARIERLRKAAEFAIYTPGSTRRPAGFGPGLVRRAGRSPCGPTRNCWASGRGTPPRACCRWPVSMRRREAASTPCSPPCSRTRGRRGATSIWPRSSTRFRPPRSRRSASSISTRSFRSATASTSR